MVVTGGKEEQKKGEGKGFAGLSSLVSDVDTTPPPAAKIEPAAAAPGAGHPAPQPAQPQPSQRQTYQEPAQPPSSGSSGGKWVLGIAAVIGVLWLIGQSDKSTTSPTPAYSPPAQTATPSYSPPPAEPQAPSRPQESMPPVGQNLVFSTAQIRYCLAEDIRMEGAKSALNNYIDSDVDRFNAMVADYNSRCGSFRYRSGALESARRDIEPYRSQLQAEGRSRFARPSTGSLSTPAPSRPAPDATVQAIQRKLNELGYDAGTADGLMGRGTRSAILAFQRDNGLVADGNPTAALLQLLTASRQVESQKTQQPTQPPTPSVAVAPPTYTPPTRAPPRQESTSVSSTEQSAIERACDSARRYSGPAVYQSCLNRELASLTSSGGRPDLSRATETERDAIERACDSARQYSGPGTYYNCLNRELSSLNASRGRPDISRASPSEQAAIERACSSARQYSGPGTYYNCLSREFSNLGASRGRPDISRFSSFEQAAIERACDSARQYSGPGTYYNCLSREISNLRSSGGAPDLSNLTSSVSAAVERACESSRQYSGPGTYYNCLRRELSSLGYR
jgi:peptidoglycan hydrolase-like protein with peptidoglycan-binding domain